MDTSRATSVRGLAAIHCRNCFNQKVSRVLSRRVCSCPDYIEFYDKMMDPSGSTLRDRAEACLDFDNIG